MMQPKKLLVCLGLVIALSGLNVASVAAATAPDPPSPVPSPTPSTAPTPTPAPYRIDISTLPKATTGAAKVQAVFGIVFGIVGALSLMMVTIGGFRYITSDGDPQKASKAKSTIMYALIGLVVSISAVTIVTFVIGRT